MKVFLLLTTMGLAVWSSPLTPPPPMCQTLLSDSGLDVNGTFAFNVAHRSHSITLEDIRYYFESEATEDNDIATVNFNVSKEADRVLPNAPLYGYDTEFTTIGLRHLDEVLSKMDKSDFGNYKYINVLGQIAHVMHMSEMWTDAKEYYEQLKQDPPTDEVCGCVTDLEETGIMAALQLLAMKIRYPGITSGIPAAGLRTSGNYTLFSWKHRPGSIEELKEFNFDEADDRLIDGVQEELVDGDDVIEQKLDSEAGWNYWKTAVKSDKGSSYGNFQFAVYMYCMFN